MSNAQRDIAAGIEYPYNDRPPKDKAEMAALGILYNFSDRHGIKNALSDVDSDVREEIVTTMADIIRTIYDC